MSGVHQTLPLWPQQRMSANGEPDDSDPGRGYRRVGWFPDLPPGLNGFCYRPNLLSPMRDDKLHTNQLKQERLSPGRIQTIFVCLRLALFLLQQLYLDRLLSLDYFALRARFFEPHNVISTKSVDNITNDKIDRTSICEFNESFGGIGTLKILSPSFRCISRLVTIAATASALTKEQLIQGLLIISRTKPPKLTLRL